MECPQPVGLSPVASVDPQLSWAHGANAIRSPAMLGLQAAMSQAAITGQSRTAASERPDRNVVIPLEFEHGRREVSDQPRHLESWGFGLPMAAVWRIAAALRLGPVGKSNAPTPSPTWPDWASGSSPSTPRGFASALCHPARPTRLRNSAILCRGNWRRDGLSGVTVLL